MLGRDQTQVGGFFPDLGARRRACQTNAAGSRRLRREPVLPAPTEMRIAATLIGFRPFAIRAYPQEFNGK